MTYCTNCGAPVSGAFCSQCGAAAPSPPSAPPSMSASPAPSGESAPVWTTAPAPPVRKTSPIVWILVILLGLFVLGGITVVGAGYFLVHKARQAGLDPKLLSRNPGLAISKMVAAANPDVEVLKTDDSAGTITVRNRKDGKVITLSFDEIKDGKFSMRAFDEEGKSATVEFGAKAKLPSWVPDYPGSTPVATFSAKGDSPGERAEAGNFSFTTKDAPEKVISFYQNKLRELSMKTEFTAGSAEGSILSATDPNSSRSLHIIVGGGHDETSVNVTYGQKP